MGADKREWAVLAELQGACITRILTCLEGEERKGALEAALKVQDGLEHRDYGALLAALDPNDGRIVHETDLIEKSILAMLYDMRLEHTAKREFKSAIGPHMEKIVGIVEAIARAKSLDIVIDKTLPDMHDRLVDYVSRVSLSRQIMTGDPQFWQWLERGYRGIDRLLRRNEKRRMSRVNSFVQMLSVQFKHRERSGAYMDYINSICEGVLDSCDDGSIDGYARKIADGYDATITEMKLFVILDREFRGVNVEARIPCSPKNADLSLEHEGDGYLVEVYTSRNFTAVGSQSKFRVRPRDEWEYLFRKRQIQDLALAAERTVFVLDVGRDYLPSDETRDPGFRDHVCRAMPETSEVVIIRDRDDIEVISVRGGKTVETTALGRELGSAIGRGWH
ncbi:MAG: hypothetical protein OXU25_01540 [Thaumarchaeota archaeon]|nr:hypothetical protein [Nitrososphaerota archaeon]